MWLFRKGIEILRQSLFVSWLLYLSICVACLIYYTFYNWYVPIGKFKSNIIFELQHLNEKSNFQYELIGTVDLFDNNGPIIHAGQDYTFRLDLEVPESDSNFDIGLFGVSADLYNIEGKKSATFKTTSTLKYRSKLLRYIVTLFQLPLLIFGSRDQKQILSIVLKDSYIDNNFSRASKLVIIIHDKLQFYNARLELEANFSGLRYYMYHWYYLTSLIICSMLILLTFSIFLTNVYNVKAMIINNFAKFKWSRYSKTSTDKEKSVPLNTLDIYKKDPNSKYTFISTTTRELKSLLDDEFDSNVLVGIENLNQSQFSSKKHSNEE